MILGFNADEVFRIAIEIEKNGITFYGKAKEIIKDKGVQEIFSQLEKEEKQHLENLEKMRAGLPAAAKQETVYDPSDDIKRTTEEETDQYIQDVAHMNVFRNAQNVEKYANEITAVEDALRLAIQFEKDSITFYLILRDLTEEDKGKEFVNGILAEEKLHLKKLSRRLRDEVGCEKMSVFQMPVCSSQTAMGAEQARADNLDEPCDDARGGV